MNKTITIRFYEELNDFLPVNKRKRDFTVPFKDSYSVKNLIESLEVPHTEDDLIFINGKSVLFSYQVKTNDRIT